VAEPGTISLLLDTDFDAAIIGCFDDTALAEITERKSRLVIGLGKAAFQRAHEMNVKFVVLTTSVQSVPVLEANIKSYGLDRHCVEVRASAIDVLDFETGRDAATEKLIRAGLALKADHPEVETIVLGCAGMGGLATQMQDAIGLEVVDPILASVECAISA
jgi:allantoin racemase